MDTEALGGIAAALAGTARYAPPLAMDVAAAIGLVAAVLGILAPVLGRLEAWIERVLPARRLWRMSDADELVICVSMSAESDTGLYTRQSTGVGQARALASIIPSLDRAYRKMDVSNIKLSTAMDGEDLGERDVVCLGGIKNNEVTRRLVDALAGRLPAELVGDQIRWLGIDPAVFEGRVVDGDVVHDYGLIVRTANPYAPQRTLVMLCGSHTFGTIAAAEAFVSELARPGRWRMKRDFAAVVGAEVIGGHVCPAEILRVEEFA